jgi:UV DNA damage endonuclease
MWSNINNHLRNSRTISICNYSRNLACFAFPSSSIPPTRRIFTVAMPPKRKRSSVATASPAIEAPTGLLETPILPPKTSAKPSLTRRQSTRKGQKAISTNPDVNPDILDGKTALRASPDADEKGEALEVEKVVPIKPPVTPLKANGTGKTVPKEENDSDSPLSDVGSPVPTPATKKQKKTPTKSSIAAKKASDEIKAFKAEQAAKKAASTTKIKKEEDAEDEWDKRLDPDGDEEGPVEDVDVLKLEAARPPPVNSDYLPLPWKGRLGYVSIMLKSRRRKRDADHSYRHV